MNVPDKPCKKANPKICDLPPNWDIPYDLDKADKWCRKHGIEQEDLTDEQAKMFEYGSTVDLDIDDMESADALFYEEKIRPLLPVIKKWFEEHGFE